MTLRQVYEGVLVELNKVQAPSMLLEDFNYLANKAINQYINKKYNVYDVNQQSTDDLRVLKSTTVLNVTKTTKYGNNTSGDVISQNSLYGATYEAFLPADYLHLLNCVCNYKVKKQFKCYDPNTYVQFGAVRLTADLWGQIINNFYMKPSYKKPYYYLHNVNVDEAVPTNPYNSSTGEGTDMNKDRYGVTPFEEYILVDQSTVTIPDANETYYTKSGDVYTVCDPQPTQWAASTDYYIYNNDDPYVTKQLGNTNLPRTFSLDNSVDASLIEKPTAQRLANTSKVRIEIRTGKDDSIFDLKSIYIDYIKAPQHLRLTQEQIDLTEDTSQMMEFPDYVCQEIINELTHLIMENSSDPRLQSHVPISMSIANPAQAPTEK